MAEQIEYEGTEWVDNETQITAARMNNIEAGVADAVNGANALGRRLVTYLVAEGGGTATADVQGDPIQGPCLVLDLAERATWYDPGTSTGGTADARTLITSGADIDAIRDSVSQTVRLAGVSTATVSRDSSAAQPIILGCTHPDGKRYLLVAATTYLGLFDAGASKWAWRITP